MTSFRCEISECVNPPRWVLRQRELDEAPECLCTPHWQEMRQHHPQQAYGYSPLAVVRMRERISEAGIPMSGDDHAIVVEQPV